MRILTGYIIREHLPPFFLAIAVFVFLFLTNLIVRSIDQLLGKGLSVWIILEYISLNLMWILALAIPMAVLVAILMSYGRMSADNEINALRSSGISFFSLIIPSLLFGSVICLFLIYFNNHILPDFNHRARLLTSAIYQKKPDVSIEPGYFIESLPDYSLLVKRKNREMLEDILIYSKKNHAPQTTIMARQGFLSVTGSRILLTLYDGEIHELEDQSFQKYRRLSFDRHLLVIPAAGMMLERQESGRRGDREMSAGMMLDKVEELREELADVDTALVETVRDKIGLRMSPAALPSWKELAGMSPDSLLALRGDPAAGDASSRRRLRKEIRAGILTLTTRIRTMESLRRRINQYLTEVYKKYSIPVACIVFVLVGAPLGVISRSGNWSVGAGFSLFFFLLYWVGLIGGEELADRLIISPFLAMWFPNMLVGTIGIYLTVRAARQQTVLHSRMVRLYHRISTMVSSPEGIWRELRGVYVRSRNSRILHHHACTYVRRIRRQNRIRYRTMEEGLESVERLCKRCHHVETLPADGHDIRCRSSGNSSRREPAVTSRIREHGNGGLIPEGAGLFPNQHCHPEGLSGGQAEGSLSGCYKSGIQCSL